MAAMHPRHRLPLAGISHVDGCAHYVLEAAAESADAGGDLVEHVDGMPARFAGRASTRIPIHKAMTVLQLSQAFR